MSKAKVEKKVEAEEFLNLNLTLLPSIWRLGIYFVILLSLLITPTSSSLAQSLSGRDLKWLEERERSSKWGRDPFLVPQERQETPQAKEELQETPLSLSAIIYREGRGIAIVNNKIMRVGDIIDKMQLIGIMEDRVILKGPMEVKELKVNKFALER